MQNHSLEMPQSLLSSEYYLLLLSATNNQGDIRIDPRAREAMFGHVDLAVYSLTSLQKHINELQTTHAVSCSETSDRALEELTGIVPLLLRQVFLMFCLCMHRKVPVYKCTIRTTLVVTTFAVRKCAACMIMMYDIKCNAACSAGERQWCRETNGAETKEERGYKQQKKGRSTRQTHSHGSSRWLWGLRQLGVCQGN